MPADELAVRLSRRRLEADLAASPVQVGIVRGWWSIQPAVYPGLNAMVAASPRACAAGWVGLRFDTAGYPDQPVTACPWDFERKALLAEDARPKGGRAAVTFRTNWEGGRALYIPCDRIAIAGHPDWLARYPEDLWEPSVGIVKYLRLVHTILNEIEYETALGAA